MTVIQQPSLDEALKHCREVTRREARNFYYGLKLTPEPKRSALYAIYAWMRRADDLVDHAGDDSELLLQQVQAFRDDTDAAIAGEPANNDPIWISLAEVVGRFELDPAYFHSMIEGQLEDVNAHRYETFKELHEYCYRVASVVGLICIQIWGCEDSRGQALAIDRGIAFQLTNIIRDFREDFEMGRVYLPAEDFASHALTPEALCKWSKPGPCEAMIAQQIQRAESYYQASEALDELIHPSCVPALWAMTSIYRGTLEKIRRDPSRIARERVNLSSWQKSAIALKAKWRAMKARSETT